MPGTAMMSMPGEGDPLNPFNRIRYGESSAACQAYNPPPPTPASWMPKNWPASYRKHARQVADDDSTNPPSPPPPPPSDAESGSEMQGLVYTLPTRVKSSSSSSDETDQFSGFLHRRAATTTTTTAPGPDWTASPTDGTTASKQTDGSQNQGAGKSNSGRKAGSKAGKSSGSGSGKASGSGSGSGATASGSGGGGAGGGNGSGNGGGDGGADGGNGSGGGGGGGGDGDDDGSSSPSDDDEDEDDEDAEDDGDGDAAAQKNDKGKRPAAGGDKGRRRSKRQKTAKTKTKQRTPNRKLLRALEKVPAEDRVAPWGETWWADRVNKFDFGDTIFAQNYLSVQMTADLQNEDGATPRTTPANKLPWMSRFPLPDPATKIPMMAAREKEFERVGLWKLDKVLEELFEGGKNVQNCFPRFPDCNVPTKLVGEARKAS